MSQHLSEVIQNKDPIVTFEDITPEIAFKFLEKNEGNRRMGHQHILLMARAMTAGTWLKTHQGIAIDVNGNLIDGQQRLSAIVSCGKTQRMMVTRGLDPDVYKVLDSGRGRTDAQRLEHDGFQHSKILGSLLRMLIQYRINEGDLSMTIQAAKRPNYQQLLDVLDAHPDAQEAAMLTGNSKPFRKLMYQSVGAYLMLHILEVEDSDYAVYWKEAMLNPLGSGLTDGDPIYVLREKLMELRTGKRPPTRAEEVVMVIKGWNCHRAGRAKITGAALAWKKMGPRRESFPDFKD